MAGERLRALQDALLYAFPSEEALRELLFRMDLKLSVVTTARSLAVMVLDVIEYTDSRGQLDEVVARACELRAQNHKLAETVRLHWPDLQMTVAAGPPVVPVLPRRSDTALSESDWQHLIRHISKKECTPVIGPGACRHALPDSVEVATDWAERWQYPFPDRTDLPRVSQFLALTEYRLLPHEQIQQWHATVKPPDYDSADEPHALLADLDLPLYLTTNYDDFMVNALATRRRRAARMFPCWNPTLREQESLDIRPVEAAGDTLVYHLFGHHEVPESMVVTEDDHFDFLHSVAAEPKLWPPAVKRALGATSLLFIGYGVLDWGFRILVRALLKSVSVSNKRLGVAVQLPPENLSESQRRQAEKYLERLLNDSGHLQFRVFWGDTREFTRALRARWEDRRRHASAS
jgi:hypothetical protein